MFTRNLMKPFPKFDAVGFFSNMLAVILGIVITFSIQGVIDRSAQKENISSALRLVETELTGCKDDLVSCADFLKQERVAAQYLKDNFKNLHSCPKDSVSQYGYTYISEMMLTLPDDALELLKTSSLFSSINDNALSLAIIRAYDQCNALRQVFNRHEEQKSQTLNQMILEKGADKCYNPNGSMSIYALMDTKNGMYLTTLLVGNHAETILEGLGDIDAAIGMIERYLGE